MYLFNNKKNILEIFKPVELLRRKFEEYKISLLPLPKEKC